MLTSETKFLSHLCDVTLNDAPGVMFRGRYSTSSGLEQRWFFLSNDARFRGIPPDGFVGSELSKIYSNAWMLTSETYAKELSRPVVIHRRITPAPEESIPTIHIPSLDDYKPMFKQIILTPNKIK